MDLQGRKQGPWVHRYETIRGERGFEEEGEYVDDRKEGLWRKYSLMAGAILFVAGSIGSAFAANVEVLLLSRVLLGVAVGIASYTAPLYLSEMASENVRGKMISMYQLMVTLGIVLAFLSDTYFSYSGN